MRTPKIYSDNLKNKIISEDMLADCIHSVNERSKTARDKRDEYRDKSDVYNNEEKYDNKVKEYHQQKEKLLSLLSPSYKVENKLYSYWNECIYYYSIDESGEEHSESEKGVPSEDEYDFSETTEEKVYEFDENYGKDFFYGEYETVVRYYKEMSSLKRIDYYLSYNIKDKKFLSRIDKEKYEQCDLPVKEFENFKTDLSDESDLLSMQFVRKVLELIDIGDYQYLKN